MGSSPYVWRPSQHGPDLADWALGTNTGPFDDAFPGVP
jgi:hypothetical protein